MVTPGRCMQAKRVWVVQKVMLCLRNPVHILLTRFSFVKWVLHLRSPMRACLTTFDEGLVGTAHAIAFELQVLTNDLFRLFGSGFKK